MITITTIKDLETYATERYDLSTEEAREKAKELASRGQDAGLQYGQDWSEWLEECDPESPYSYGYVDGVSAFNESGSTADPVNGWDGDLINAIGFDGVYKMFRLPQPDDFAGDDWTDDAKAALAEYVRGCRAGVVAAEECNEALSEDDGDKPVDHDLEITSVTVYCVKPHHAGFGMYQRAVEGVTYGGMESLDDYVTYVNSVNESLRLLTEDDEEYGQVKDADGKTYDQGGGKIIGWKDREGNVTLELICEDQ